MATAALQVHRFAHSRYGAADRKVRVWLPRDYHQSTERYPVVYLQDGQNLFEAETAFGGVAWGVGDTAHRLTAARRMQAVILVGIDNAGALRTDEYTPVPWRGRGGHVDAYGHMLIDEIKPAIDRLYRTKPERESTAIGGASLGGLCALWLALARSDVFGHVAAMSPSLFWGNGHMSRVVAALPARLPVRIWLDSGKREAPFLRRSVRELADQLESLGFCKHRTARRADLRTAEVARAGHDEASWGRRFDRVLKFLFPPLPKPKRRKAKGAA